MATHLSMLLQNREYHTATTHHNLQRPAQAAERRSDDEFIVIIRHLPKMG